MSTSSDQKRILIADDNVPGRILLRAFLNHLGLMNVEEAHDSLEALRLLMLAAQNGKPFSAVLIDWTMNEMKELEVIRTIRKLPGWEKLPIFVLSEELDPAKVQKVTEAGGTAHLLRPIMAPVLRALLTQHGLLP